MCPSSAFIDVEQYGLMNPPKEYKLFKLWAADMAAKYPELLGAYVDLRDCWETYHKPKT